MFQLGWVGGKTGKGSVYDFKVYASTLSNNHHLIIAKSAALKLNMRRAGAIIGQFLLLFISFASAFSKPPPLTGAYTPDRSEPIDYVTPSYRVPLLSLHRNLIELFTPNTGEFTPSYIARHFFNSLNYTVEIQHPDDGGCMRFGGGHAYEYNVLVWPRGANITPATTHLHNRILLTSQLFTYDYDSRFPYIIRSNNTPVITPHTRSPPPPPSSFPTLPSTTVLHGPSSDAVASKAVIAAQLTAAAELLASGAVRPEALVFLFVADEAGSGRGMRRFSEDVARNAAATHPARRSRTPFRAAIFGAPTRGRLVCSHRGLGTVFLSALYRDRGNDTRRAEASVERAVGRVRALVAGAGADAGGVGGEMTVAVVWEGAWASEGWQYAEARLEVAFSAGGRETAVDRAGYAIRRAVMDGAEGKAERVALRVLMHSWAYGPVACECEVNGQSPNESPSLVPLLGVDRVGGVN